MDTRVAFQLKVTLNSTLTIQTGISHIMSIQKDNKTGPA